MKLCRRKLHTYPDDKKSCPECWNIARNKRYHANPEPFKKRAAKWYAENKEQVNDYHNNYIAEHREEWNAYMREYQRKKRAQKKLEKEKK